MSAHAQPVVFTLAARCRDCYRCLRICPVKAIRIQDGQASVDAQRCIGCGTCIRECPQKAKTSRSDIERVQDLMGRGKPVAISLAPSYAAVFSPWERKRLVSALRKLGASYVGESSIGAGPVADESRRLSVQTKSSSVCTACPAVVKYVERYRPGMLKSLLPVASPMIVHARQIRQRLGPECVVIFIGPCVAKKLEADRDENAGLIDAVLTFSELKQLFDKRGILLAQCEESDCDEEPDNQARYFPLPGGLVKTAALDSGGMTLDILQVSGFTDVSQALDAAQDSDTPFLLEPLFCLGGCIDGPGIASQKNVFERRRMLLQYAQEARKPAKTSVIPSVDLSGVFQSDPPPGHTAITEEDIVRALDKTGKADPQQQLNCGACGYSSCRDNAIAVLCGMAEPDMCIPYMRRMAERRTDRIIETSPNGIVILDESLNILSMNPAFRRFFQCSDALLGQPIARLMDPAPFEKLASGAIETQELVLRHAPYAVTCHELLYALREHRQYVGIFVDITGLHSSEQQLSQLREQTRKQAQEWMDHQLKMAQDLVQFLGENTARNEDLVKKFLSLFEHDHSSRV